MGILFNGNAWEVQSHATTGGVIINGLNIGSDSTSAFTLPLDFHLQTKVFGVCSTDTSCTVTPAAGATINGGAGAVTVSALTGKTFFATADNTWISF